MNSVSPSSAQPIDGTQPVSVRVPVITLGSHPWQCTCPYCGRQIVTRTEKKIGLLPWILFAVLFLFGFVICAFIPFCVDELKDTAHYCPSCNALLGRKKR
ncbi:unnamed protein product [Adineta steineri]|uniref:LITAF domain-containing protein n=1 Tax=Adineta steineri TaxID=433720 RepID=A0A818SCC4_9BILA|nr:unnamed protein product [Adineta steineri]CAF3669118.1 unnamed protein product [Adineta steineri]